MPFITATDKFLCTLLCVCECLVNFISIVICVWLASSPLGLCQCVSNVCIAIGIHSVMVTVVHRLGRGPPTSNVTPPTKLTAHVCLHKYVLANPSYLSLRCLLSRKFALLRQSLSLEPLLNLTNYNRNRFENNCKIVFHCSTITVYLVHLKQWGGAFCPVWEG